MVLAGIATRAMQATAPLMVMVEDTDWAGVEVSGEASELASVGAAVTVMEEAIMAREVLILLREDGTDRPTMPPIELPMA